MYDSQRVARGAGAAIAIWTLIGLVFLSSGVAYAVPLAGLGGFNATIGVVESDSLALYTDVGDTAERAAYPQSIIELQNTRIKDLEAYKDLDVSSFPGVSGTARFRLASDGDIDSNNVLIKSSALTADDAQFDGFRIDDEGTGDPRTAFELYADDRARLETVKIRAHYLTASRVDLTDLSLAVCYDSNNDGVWEQGPCDGTSTFVRNNDAAIATADVSPGQIESGETVTFDASASTDVDGSIVSYEWRFGDGATANGQSVSHTYDDAGEYTATVKVIDNEGAVSYDTATVDVTGSYDDIRIQADANRTKANPGQVVVFDALASSAPDSFIEDYDWNFGDGTTTEDDMVEHRFDSAGTYTVTLTTTSHMGQTATDTVQIDIVPNEPPTADATANRTTQKVEEPISFDATGSTDSDGRVTDYTWAFGDGTTVTGPTATHTYTSAGEYTVTLTTGDNDGASSTDTIDVTVQPNEPPSADLNVNKTTAKVARLISFDASGSSDPDGTIERYEWDLGDGTTATGTSLTHSYGSAGTYQVSLTLTDDKGKSTTETVDIAIDTNEAPSVTADATPTAVNPGDSVAFSGSATDPDGTVERYEWAFGDGATATGANPSHTYSSTGSYTATLTVTDSYGTTSTDTVTVDVSQNAAPSVSASANRTEIKPGDPISFSGSASDADGTVESSQWAFGDGATASGTSAVHSYGTTGYFTVEFDATDDDGATGSETLTVHVVDNYAPTASVSANRTSVSPGDAISFDASGSADPDDSSLGYSWDFGDGSTTSGASSTQTHSFGSTGTYTVTVTVNDDDGKTDTATVQIDVS